MTQSLKFCQSLRDYLSEPDLYRDSLLYLRLCIGLIGALGLVVAGLLAIAALDHFELHTARRGSQSILVWIESLFPLLYLINKR